MRLFNTAAPWLIEMGLTQAKNVPRMFTNSTRIQQQVPKWVCQGLHADDGLVRGMQTAVDSLYTDLAVRFEYEPPKFLSQHSVEFWGFVISESQDEKLP